MESSGFDYSANRRPSLTFPPALPNISPRWNSEPTGNPSLTLSDPLNRPTGKETMTQILYGALILSLLHALIPNHWIPLVAIGRGGNWSRGETLGVTAIAGGAHILSTILVGIVVGFVGVGLSSSYELVMDVAAPIILIVLGIVFVWMDMRGGDHHGHDHEVHSGSSHRSKVAIIVSLTSAMFFSPCLEIEAYYFTVSHLGWSAIFAVSLIYFAVTLSGMLLLVYLGLRGLEKLRWTYLEHHEKQVTGITLIALGLLAYLVESY